VIDPLERDIAEQIARDADLARHEADPPSSARVWWRSQMRARQEAARRADRPLSVVHALAIASGIGLVLGLTGIVFGWLRGAGDRLMSLYDYFAAAAPAGIGLLSSPWVLLPTTAMLVIFGVAVYVIFADE
jgi:hypothetical protein